MSKNDQPPQNENAKAIGRLTKAIWALAIIVCFRALISLFSIVSPFFFTRHLVPSQFEPMLQHQINSVVDAYNGFHEWPIEKQVSVASVIAISKFQKSGDSMKCIISEILKQTPNTSFYYKIGDEFPELTQHIEANTNYGDGQIMFFTGSPAQFRCSASLTNGRIGGMGDVPIDNIRKMIHGQNK